MKLRTWLTALTVLIAIIAGGFFYIRSQILAMSERAYPKAAAMPQEVAEPMEQILARLESSLAESAPQVLEALQPGLSENRIEELEREGGFRLSPELQALYRWRNGTSGDSAADFIPGHRFASLDEVIQQKALEAEQLKQATALQRAVHRLFAGHRRTWLPLLTDGAGDGYFFDPARPSEDGAVFFNFSESGHYVFFPSAKNLFVALAECYESGAYSVNSAGRLVEKHEQSESVWARYGGTQPY